MIALCLIFPKKLHVAIRIFGAICLQAYRRFPAGISSLALFDRIHRTGSHDWIAMDAVQRYRRHLYLIAAAFHQGLYLFKATRLLAVCDWRIFGTGHRCCRQFI